jgi:mono/diheme cytochrome c family protein
MRIQSACSIAAALWIAVAVTGFDRGEARSPGAEVPPEPDSDEPAGRDLDAGIALFSRNCAGCHGEKGHGVENRGVPLRTSEFVRSQGDHALIAFIKRGRARTSPKSKTDAKMPGRGGNPVLSDDGVRDIVAFLRVLQEQAAAEGEQMPDPIPVSDS